jgi:3-oxoacyl-[acyl-carrier protein] reductase
MEKVYLILGASSDLGITLMRKLINDKGGDIITIIAHYNSSKDEIEKISVEYGNIDIRMVKADLSNLDETKRMISAIKEMQLEPTHIVNLTANKFQYTRLKDWDSELVNKDMTIQVYSFAEVLKAFIPNMVKNKYGKIVVMLTAYTIGIPPKNMSGYVAVKYALLGLMKSMASDYGDQGININGVSPNMINTKFLNGVGRKVREMTAESSPRHRNLEVDDVIPTICLLLSDDAEFISGTNINLSGHTD